MPDWYRTHSLSPECYPDSEYRDWAQDNGLYVDEAGNVDYDGPRAVDSYRAPGTAAFPHRFEDDWDDDDDD